MLSRPKRAFPETKLEVMTWVFGLSLVWSFMLDDKTCIDIVLIGLMAIVAACYITTQQRSTFEEYPSKKRHRKVKKVTSFEEVAVTPEWVAQTYPLELYGEVLHADLMCGYSLVCRPKRMWSEC